nr:hypothetical protein [Tanacetum cinerariifolium]
MEPNKTLNKDVEAEDVDVNLYRSMIGSLTYLTAFRPDIMFDVCACARFQVTPKSSNLHVVKRIFIYLKGQPKLGLWYHRDSPFDLKDFSDSDYAGASLDRKSRIGSYQFLGKRLSKEFWTSAMVKTIKDYVRIEALVDGKKVVVKEASIKHDLRLDDAEGTACLPNDAIFEELARIGAKTTAWNEFSNTMASAFICLANNQKFNFSKYILENMVLDLEKAKTAQAKEIADLKKRVKKLKRKKKSRTLGLKRLYKIGLSARIVSSDEEDQGRMNDQDLFGVHDLDGDEVFVDVTNGENVEQDATVAKKEVTTIEDIKVTTTIAAATTP